MNSFGWLVVAITTLALITLMITSTACLQDPEFTRPLLLDQPRLLGWYAFWMFAGLCLPILEKFKYQFRTITDLVILNAYQAAIILSIVVLQSASPFTDAITGVFVTILLYNFSKYLIIKYG